MKFEEILRGLPPVEHLERLELFEPDNPSPIASIENRPGSQGSLRVYHAVTSQSGRLGPEEAKQALELFAEHTGAARQHPGTHPNIDRLFQVTNEARTYIARQVLRIVPSSAEDQR